VAALKSIVAGVLILALALLARPILVRALRLRTPPPVPAEPAALPARPGRRAGTFGEDSRDAADAIINVRRVEDRVKAASARRVAALLDRNPDLAARAMRRWLAEGTNSR